MSSVVVIKPVDNSHGALGDTTLRQSLGRSSLGVYVFTGLSSFAALMKWFALLTCLNE